MATTGRRRDPHTAVESLRVLGLGSGATAADIRRQRRQLARSAHPDAGGSIEQMQAINQAAAEALAMLGRTPSSEPLVGWSPTERRGYSRQQDHPSFVVEASAAETFDGLLIVAAWYGEVADHDRPSMLHIRWGDRADDRLWCQIDVTPEAGASTVSVTIQGGPGGIGVTTVRDLLIDGLNRLDWESLGNLA